MKCMQYAAGALIGSSAFAAAGCALLLGIEEQPYDGADGATSSDDAEIADTASSGPADTRPGADGTGSADGADATDSTADRSLQPVTADLRPTKDAYVQDGLGASGNFGTAMVLVVKTTPLVGVNRTTWLSFDISSFSAITSAKLLLYEELLDMTNTNDVPAIVSYAPTASDGWGQLTITWNTAPPAGNPVAMALIPNGTVGAWFEWDVTSSVAADSDGVSTFVITSDTSSARGCNWSSSRGSQPPILRITGKSWEAVPP
jgi:hypothetical protein